MATARQPLEPPRRRAPSPSARWQRRMGATATAPPRALQEALQEAAAAAAAAAAAPTSGQRFERHSQRERA